MAGEREQEVTMTSETEARGIAHEHLCIDFCPGNEPGYEHSDSCNALTASILAYGDKRAVEMRERCAALAEDAPAWKNIPGDFEANSIATAIRALPERTEP